MSSGQAVEAYHFQFVGNGANALVSYRGAGLVITRNAAGRIKIVGPTPMKTLVHAEATMADLAGQGNLVILLDHANSNSNSANGFDVRLTCTTSGNTVSDVPAGMRVSGIVYLSPRDWGKGL
jgi:hypothetical protein